jgi:hypothetical protein
MVKKSAAAVADDASADSAAKSAAKTVAKTAAPLSDAQRQKLVADIAKALQAHGIGFTVWHGEMPNQTVH